MKKVIVAVGFVLLGIAIVGLITGTLQNSINTLIGNTITDINGVNPNP
jgi:uncharacterized membrane protein YbaN (DUF454 family)